MFRFRTLVGFRSNTLAILAAAAASGLASPAMAGGRCTVGSTFAHVFVEPVVEVVHDDCLPSWDYCVTARFRDRCGTMRTITLRGCIKAECEADVRYEARCKIRNEVSCRFPGARIRSISVSVTRDDDHDW